MKQRKVAIIGGGVSGLSAAYFLEECDDLAVTLYEKDTRLGGHAMTFDVPRQGGGSLPIDPVVCLFMRSRHPFFTAWMESLGVMRTPFTFENYLWNGHQGRGVLITSDKKKILAFAGRSLSYLSDLLMFKRVLGKAAELERKGLLADELRMKDFLAEVPNLSRRFVEEVFFPLMQFAFHADRRELYELPCGATLRSYLQAAQAPGSGYYIAGGVRRYVETVRSELRRTEVRLGAGIVSLARSDGARPWLVRASDGSTETYDDVVLAVWPNQAAELLDGCTEDEALVTALRAVKRSHCRATIHDDRRLMPEEKRHWTTYCYKFMPYLRNCFATIWSGQIHDEPVFTSYDWSDDEQGVSDESTQTRIQGRTFAVNTHFRTPPRAPLYEARRRVAAAQGKQGLWFTGAYLRATGFHEDAFVSTLDMIQGLVPEPRALPRLREVLERAQVNERKRQASDGFRTRSSRAAADVGGT